MALTQSQLEELKEKLRAQQEKLESVFASLKEDDPASDITRTVGNADVGSEANEDNDLVMYESLERETEAILTRTKEALARIDDGTYGKTADGEDIPYERLLIDPTATTNVK